MPDFGWVGDNRAAHAKPQYKYVPKADPNTLGAAHEVGKRWPVPAGREDLHACAANAIAGAISLTLYPDAPETVQPSVRFIYYIGRYLQDREHDNNGASLYASLRACMAIGFCADAVWPLAEGKPDADPTPDMYRAAAQNGILEFYYLERDLTMLKSCLAEGHPFMFGAAVDAAFLAGVGDNVVGRPTGDTGDNRHCLLAVGYTDPVGDTPGYFTVRDSIGPDRGEGGYIKIAYEYVTDPTLVDDFWMINALEAPGGAELAQKRADYVQNAVDFRKTAAAAYARVRPNRSYYTLLGELPGSTPKPPIADQIQQVLQTPPSASS